MKSADSRGMATVLRRVREPRQKSDESLRADVNKNVSDDPDRLLARPVVSHIASIPYPASTLRECFCPRSRKTSSAAAPVGQLARNAVRDWNSVPVLVERKDGGFATGEFLCYV